MGLRRVGASARNEDEEVRKTEGESAAFEVQVEPESVPHGASLKFAWLREDSELMLGSRSGVQEVGLTSRLQIFNLSTLDCGRYTCVVLAHRDQHSSGSKKHNINANNNNNNNSNNNGSSVELRTHFRLHVTEQISDDDADDSDPSKAALSARIRRLHRRHQHHHHLRHDSPARADLRTESPCRGDAANNNESIDATSTADEAFRFWSPAFRRRPVNKPQPPPIAPKPKLSRSSSSSAHSMQSPSSSPISSPRPSSSEKSKRVEEKNSEENAVANGSAAVDDASMGEENGAMDGGGGEVGDRISPPRKDEAKATERLEVEENRKEGRQEEGETPDSSLPAGQSGVSDSKEQSEDATTQQPNLNTQQSTSEGPQRSQHPCQPVSEQRRSSVESAKEECSSDAKSHRDEEHSEKSVPTAENSEQSNEPEPERRADDIAISTGEADRGDEESQLKSGTSEEPEPGVEVTESGSQSSHQSDEKSENQEPCNDSAELNTEVAKDITETSHQSDEKSEHQEPCNDSAELNTEVAKDITETSHQSDEKSEHQEPCNDSAELNTEVAKDTTETSHQSDEKSEHQEPCNDSAELNTEVAKDTTETSHLSSETSEEANKEAETVDIVSTDRSSSAAINGSADSQSALRGAAEEVLAPEAEVGSPGPAEVTLTFAADAGGGGEDGERPTEEEEDMAEKVTLRFKGGKEEVAEPAFPDRDVEIQVGKDPWTTYEKLEKIGSGGFSEVFRCRELDSDLILAAKVVRYRASNKASILYEVDILRTLKHTQVMRLYDVYDHGRRMILISEYISGGELCERIIEDNFLSEEQSSYFVTQILRGVAYLHSQSIIHLDLKPENIVCASHSSYDIKIIDFGFAQRYEKGHGAKEIRFLGGTANFTAPEVINYEPLDFAADVWAIGVITYLLISGYAPFDGDSDQEVLVNVTRGVYDYDDEAFESISNAARDFIDSILVKQPSKRPTAEELKRHDWLRCRGHRSTLHLPNAVSHLRNYVTKAKGKWVKATNAIIAMQKFSRTPV